jgi:hypothetical protein
VAKRRAAEIGNARQKRLGEKVHRRGGELRISRVETAADGIVVRHEAINVRGVGKIGENGGQIGSGDRPLVGAVGSPDPVIGGEKGRAVRTGPGR